MAVIPSNYKKISNSCYCGVGLPGRLRWYWNGPIPEYYDAPSGYCNPNACSNSACSSKGCANARKQYCQKHGTKVCGPNIKVCASDPCTNTTTPRQPVPKRGGTPIPKTNPPPTSSTPQINDSQIGDIIIDEMKKVCNTDFNSIEVGFIKRGANSGQYQTNFKLIKQAYSKNDNTSVHRYANQIANSFRCSNADDNAFRDCKGGCSGANHPTTPPSKTPTGGCPPCTGIMECINNVGCNAGNFFKDMFQAPGKFLSDQQNIWVIGIGAVALVVILGMTNVNVRR